MRREGEGREGCKIPELNNSPAYFSRLATCGLRQSFMKLLPKTTQKYHDFEILEQHHTVRVKHGDMVLLCKNAAQR